MEKSFLSECKQSSSLTLLALFNLFLIGLFPLLQHHQRVRNQDESMITNTEQQEENEEDYLSREDVEMVMRSLGLILPTKKAMSFKNTRVPRRFQVCSKETKSAWRK
ncbi:unnamed protein product [Eruca vesicaria subsp. sativa]|uniref:Uncharacterized protein n=1 Tax=Eruca vesicaria subsp. sativa TaxID=29727 RepID=A0ABC8JN83_ERUVS|nr:unnamed protein product [Eruca vesicaria subsp. sativa]